MVSGKKQPRPPLELHQPAACSQVCAACALAAMAKNNGAMIKPQRIAFLIVISCAFLH